MRGSIPLLFGMCLIYLLSTLGLGLFVSTISKTQQQAMMTSIFFFLGYGLGVQFQDLIEHLEKEISPYKPVFFLLLLGAIAAYLSYIFIKHPIPTGDPEELPIFGNQIAHMGNKEASSRESGPAIISMPPVQVGKTGTDP